MPLSKLQNFIKNTEGKILYVNPNDINATDSIENQGNSLSQPFKTIQRALLESARFSYVRGNDNDLFDRTTILLFPGEHFVDNRPGFRIKDDGGIAKAISPAGTETLAQDTLSLSLDSVFDLNVEDNMLYKFNSSRGGTILPRGTSIVGLDLRKTKIRPLYVPNPTDSDAYDTSLIRLTGTCYFRDFTFFDGGLNTEVYTDPQEFSDINKSKPTFSHHKLTCFGFADGVNKIDGTGLTDLDMYYSKLSNAFNEASGRNIDQKFPSQAQGFSKSRIEWEIVGAFASDPISISAIKSGDGVSPSTLITVDTNGPHELSVGTPIKIKGVTPADYNISTFVQSVVSATQFTYLLPDVDPTLLATGSISGADATIETDTVTGASPYVFNVSLRSVYGMNGMVADGATAAGFRSMVVAQFTAVSLQKDDRAFVKYNPVSRTYDGITVSKVTGAELASGSSSTNSNTVYHLDSRAVYRKGWETSHISMINDSIIQIVSVFAIGFNKHFNCESGGDASITNSNSNFGQIALVSEGFKKEAFAKDDQGYITSIVAPQTISEEESNIDLFTLDIGLTTSVGITSHLYLFGFTDQDNPPAIISQGYRIGARENDKLYVDINDTVYDANILITDTLVSTGTTIATGQGSKERITNIVGLDAEGRFSCQVNHNLQTGEKVRIYSEDGDIPENLEEDTVYYAIVDGINLALFRVASTLSDALRGEAITVYGGTGLRVESRVSDKAANEIGCPILYDPNHNNWFIHVNENNNIYNSFLSEGGVIGIGAQTSETFVKRRADNRSLGDKVYKVRYFIPKESTIGRNPVEGFILQDSNTTAARNNQDFTISTIDVTDYDFGRNPRYISTCSVSGSTVTTRVDLPHNLNVGDIINIVDVESTTNPTGAALSGYNGTFTVTQIEDDKTFTYGTTDIDGILRVPGDFTSDMNTRVSLMARYQRVNNNNNISLYRSEVIQNHIPGISDGIYHFNILAANNTITEEFDNLSFLPKIERFYPQLDRDNVNSNPRSAQSFAKRNPIGDVAVDDPENSITRESVNYFSKVIGYGRTIVSYERNDVVGIATVEFDRPHGFSGIVTYSALNNGSGFTEGEYYNTKLYRDGTSEWSNATAKVTIGSGGAVESVEIIDGGSFISEGDILDLDGFTGADITAAVGGITSCIGNSIQLTGIGKTDDGIYQISSVVNEKKISFAVTTGDPNPFLGQFVLDCGQSIGINTVESFSGISTIITNDAHGLVAGSSFRVIDTSNNNVGDFTVLERVGINTFTVSTQKDLTRVFPNKVLPTAFAAKGGEISAETESIGSRVFNIYNQEYGILNNDLGEAEADNKVKIQLVNSGVGTDIRFPIGSFIEVNGEIMRIASSQLSGSNNDELEVIRGYVGSKTKTHQQGTLVKKIDVRGVELRRPSILRGSGHTFEYLGYGPGNYSTGLPQVQTITLTDKEEFLTQSQKRSGGVVVYTAMNNDGDFFIGNKIINPSTGAESTFDAPIPTVRGEDASVLSVIFDEVTVRQRLIVEGGPAKTLLSQFDGPLRVNNVVNITGNTKIDANLEVTGRFRSSGSADIQGALNVAGVGTFAGKIEGDAGADLANVRIGVGASTGRIESLNSENLVLKSATTNVMVEDNLNVDGNIVCDRIEADNIIPVGGIIPWSGTSSNFPTGWLVCDGSEVSQTTYPDLYDTLTDGGTVFPYGANPSGTTFLIPNLEDRFVVTAGNTYNRGGTGGQANASVIDHTHTITNDPVAAHSHNIGDEPAHTHPLDPIAAHDHNVDPVADHSHTVNPGGGHGHPSRGANAPHAHTVNPGGAHGHPSRGANAPHSHQLIRFNRGSGAYFQGRNNSRVNNPAFATRPTTGANAPHSHVVNPVGNHGHPSRGANAPHSHVVNPGGNHAHPSRSAGGHTHNADPAGAHTHTANPAGGHAHPIGPNGGHTHPATADPAGVSGTNRNLPPYFGLFYIIKAL
jgi:hypothetical protein